MFTNGFYILSEVCDTKSVDGAEFYRIVYIVPMSSQVSY